MPKSPRDKKRRNYNNGGGLTRPSLFYEQNGRRVSAGRSRKNPCRVGWGTEPTKKR